MTSTFFSSVLVFLMLFSIEAQLPPFPNIPIGGGTGTGGGGVGSGIGGGVPGIINNWPMVGQQQLTGIIDVLRTAGFSLAGLALKAVSNFIPAYTTFLIPTNQAIADFVDFNQTNMPSLLLYHAVVNVLPFNTLTQYPVGQELPTMLFGRSVRVTSNSSSSYELNNVRVVRPNLCGNAAVIACHGIDGVLTPTANLASASPPGLAPSSSPEGSVVSPSGSQMTPPPQRQTTIPGSAISPSSPPVTVGISPSGTIIQPSGAAAVTQLTAVSLVLTAFVAMQ